MKKVKKVILISLASIVGIIGMLVAFVVIRLWPAFEDRIFLSRGKVAKEYCQIKDAERIETLAAYVRTGWPDDDMHSLPEAAILSHHNVELIKIAACRRLVPCRKAWRNSSYSNFQVYSYFQANLQ